MRNAAAHMDTDREEPGGVSSTASAQCRLSTGSQGQVVRSRLEGAPATHIETIHSPPSSQAAPGKEDGGSQGSVCCVSGRAVVQSLLCSCTVGLPACVTNRISLQSSKLEIVGVIDKNQTA